ncbi:MULTISPECIES: enoyl-CoA hydratase [Mycobacterium]|uniref:Enoyl-CoA hydratase n=1 Tax=Mycobacterium kiyosense TaxID=2871094 RepID=A0A9P3QA75_9MYCO|nr:MULTISPECIES: enoyl-CoA hydratase [Mycobacterium]BDB43755.1 enoyl-CoA hydratase [Mycobacterium kiyosense]BDE15320.1 enoyl-CoA hydratase [Mycobacterium sp. 20KCMC460]GLB83986.1 enoyl-CoA hydratase [Mycobacterium kiyosense]GLB91488.1 enoyl-CoA hydratase [Mycobacterium kiyosense]GLB97369.1 enoyl-CoA hydratase [Mycobacterium kiyosense]
MTTDGSAVAERPIASSEPVLYEVSESGVAVITLNRPERRNAWGGGMTDRFFRYVETAEADSNVRVILLTGSGGAFCVGADMGDLDSISSTTIESAGKTDVRSLVAEKHPYFLTQLRKPVITAINGSVAGIGLSLALMSDVRFAAAGAKFTTSFARRGLVAEYGISWILPRLVGWGAAIDLLLSGRTFLAEEALELGLVKEVVPGEQLLGRALSYAEDIARNCAPSSLAVMKQQLYADAELPIVQTSEKAEQLMHESMTRSDFIEGITAFFQKRAPNFPSLTAPKIDDSPEDHSPED